MIYNSIKRVTRLLSKEYKLKSISVILLLLINSIVDLLGLAAVLPILGLVLQDDFMDKYPEFTEIMNWLGFSEKSEIVIAVSCGVFLIILVKNVFGVLINRYQVRFIYSVFMDFSKRIYNAMLKLNYSDFNKINPNVIQRDISHIPRMFSMLLLTPLLSFLTELVVLSVIIISVVIINFKVVLLILCSVLPIYLIFYQIFKKKISYFDDRLNALVPLATKNVFDSIYGYVDIYMTHTWSLFRSRMDGLLSEEATLRTRQTVYNLTLPRIVELSMIIALISMFLYGFWFLDDTNDILILFGIFGLATYRSVPSINRMISALVHIKGKQYTLDALESLLDINPSFKDESSDNFIHFSESIHLDSVHFSYDNSKRIIEDFSLWIEKGQTIGLIGESGAGKTTLINLLLGFLKPIKGAIVVDGEEVSEENLSSWRSNIGYVKQDTFLLDDTIEKNIAFGQSEVDHLKMESVIEDSSLKAFIDHLPNGLKTMVGDRGAQLSGGQKQRVGIARALYNGVSIIIFDEATSALDSKTEQEITASIKKLKKNNITMIIIAHKFSTLKYCDKVYELRDKNLTERN